MSTVRESWWMSAGANLRECPFCGGDASIVVAKPEDNDHLLFTRYSVGCKKCGMMIGTIVHGQTDFFDTIVEAVGTWNTRWEPGKEEGE